jgi:hypothetical protein
MMPRSRRPRKPYRPPAEVPAALAAKREREARDSKRRVAVAIKTGDQVSPVHGRLL